MIRMAEIALGSSPVKRTLRYSDLPKQITQSVQISFYTRNRRTHVVQDVDEYED